MFIFNSAEIIEDIFASEGTKVKMSDKIKTFKLYSDWVEDSLSDSSSSTVSDLAKRIAQYLEQCTIPELDIPLAAEFPYHLYAGNQEPLNLIVRTTDEEVLKKEAARVFSKESIYTLCFVCCEGEDPVLYVRKAH